MYYLFYFNIIFFIQSTYQKKGYFYTLRTRLHINFFVFNIYIIFTFFRSLCFVAIKHSKEGTL